MLPIVLLACLVLAVPGGARPCPPQRTAPGPQPAVRDGSPAAIDDALSKVSPSLVRIHVVSVEHQDGREIKREAAGSGTIISAEGHVLTNHHVAGRTRAIYCTLATREEIPAELVGTDPLSDIAILKLKPAAPRKFPVARLRRRRQAESRRARARPRQPAGACPSR